MVDIGGGLFLVKSFRLMSCSSNFEIFKLEIK